MVDEAHAIQFQHSLKLCEVFGEFSDTEVNHGIPAVEKRDGSGGNRNRTVSIDQALYVQTPGKPLAALLNRIRRHIGADQLSRDIRKALRDTPATARKVQHH